MEKINKKLKRKKQGWRSRLRSTVRLDTLLSTLKLSLTFKTLALELLLFYIILNSTLLLLEYWLVCFFFFFFSIFLGLIEKAVSG